MEGQTIVERTEQITFEGKTYSMGYGKFVEFFETLGKVWMPCEAGACKYVDIVSTGFGGQGQKCNYEPTDLEWLESDDDGEFEPSRTKCYCIDDKIKEFIKAGLFDDFLLE